SRPDTAHARHRLGGEPQDLGRALLDLGGDGRARSARERRREPLRRRHRRDGREAGGIPGLARRAGRRRRRRRVGGALEEEDAMTDKDSTGAYSGFGAEWRATQLRPDEAKRATDWVEAKIDKRALLTSKERKE